MEKLFAEIKDIVVAGKHAEVEALVEKAIAEGADLDDLINQALIAAMDIVGRRFAASEIFVPELLVSAMTMKKGLELIKPLLKEEQSQSKGKVVLCTVKGDLHDIGKNLVAMMLEGAGLEVMDLGVDSTVEMVIAKVQELQPDVLGMSALLTTTMPEMEKVITRRSGHVGPADHDDAGNGKGDRSAEGPGNSGNGESNDRWCACGS
jgi:5-methyltetrahydrofolate--homocysteine methyltransferase